jgi:hypothetical protein
LRKERKGRKDRAWINFTKLVPSCRKLLEEEERKLISKA